MHILDKIVNTKKDELKLKTISLDELQVMIEKQVQIRSLKKSLLNKPGVIAEFKRKSPSKSWINQFADVKEVAKIYEIGGAAAMSVLTDSDYFGGSLEDLQKARENIQIPILRKEFMIDPYQIYEARAYGADLILLIARILTPKEIYDFSKLAHSLNLEVLLEVHDEGELEGINFDHIDLVGVNNRNLDTFTMDLNTSFNLYSKLPEHVVKISESGIFNVEVVHRLIDVGYRGFLIGENFMKEEYPQEFFKSFVEQISRS